MYQQRKKRKLPRRAQDDPGLRVHAGVETKRRLAQGGDEVDPPVRPHPHPPVLALPVRVLVTTGGEGEIRAVPGEIGVAGELSNPVKPMIYPIDREANAPTSGHGSHQCSDRSNPSCHSLDS